MRFKPRPQYIPQAPTTYKQDYFQALAARKAAKSQETQKATAAQIQAHALQGEMTAAGAEPPPGQLHHGQCSSTGRQEATVAIVKPEVELGVDIDAFLLGLVSDMTEGRPVS
jgi:hypothetical protein